MSPQIRLLAGIGLLAALALAAGLILLSRGQSSSSAATPKTIKPLHAVKQQVRKPTAKKPVAPKPAKKAPTVIDGMPARLARELAAHDVVVVSLYAPRSTVDDLARKEARAGAAVAGAGYVALNVANNADAVPLTGMLSSISVPADRVLDAPAVLVFQRPKTLFVRLTGFADRQTVAQAAENAAPITVVAPPTPTAPKGWIAQANAICTRMSGELQTLATPTTPAEILPWVEKVTSTLQTAVADLHKLKAAPPDRALARQMLADYDQMLASLRATVAAAKRGDRALVDKLDAKTKELGKQGDAIADQLGATACSSAGS